MAVYDMNTLPGAESGNIFMSNKHQKISRSVENEQATARRRDSGTCVSCDQIFRRGQGQGKLAGQKQGRQPLPG